MKDILIVGRDFHPDGKETAAALADALRMPLEELGHQTSLGLLNDILFDIANDRIRIIHVPSGRDLADFGAVLITNWFSHASVRKDMAHTIALYLDSKQVPCFNTEALASRSTSKLSQMMVAALQGVPIARTVFCLSLEHLQQYLTEQQWETPFIFKDAQASRGNGNYLLEELADISKHASEHSEKNPFMAQVRIDSDGSDFRFFLAGGKIRLVIKRTGSGDSHLNNTSAGGTGELAEINTFAPEVIKYIEQMSRSLRREVTGIDIMFDKSDQTPYFLEANPIPQIATGSNVEHKLRALAESLHEAAIRSGS